MAKNISIRKGIELVIPFNVYSIRSGTYIKHRPYPIGDGAQRGDRGSATLWAVVRIYKELNTMDIIKKVMDKVGQP